MARQFYEIKDIRDVNVHALLRMLGVNSSSWNVFGRFTNEWRYVTAILRSWGVLKKYEITNPYRIAHFLGQGIVETDLLRAKSENLNYSADRLLEVFSRNVVPSRQDAERVAGNPEKVANLIYANRNGNGDEASGDGWRYRGRGFFQLTGRANYERYGEIAGIDLVNDPDIISRDLRKSVEVAAAYFGKMNLGAFADENDSAAVSRGVNLGDPNRTRAANHERERTYWTNRVLRLFENPDSIMKDEGGDEEDVLQLGSNGGDVKQLQKRLARLGYNVGAIDGGFGQNTERAVLAFQREYGLEENGVVDQVVADVIEEVLAEQKMPRAGATNRDLRHAGVRDPGNVGQQTAGGVVAGAGTVAAANETGVLESSIDTVREIAEDAGLFDDAEDEASDETASDEAPSTGETAEAPEEEVPGDEAPAAETIDEAAEDAPVDTAETDEASEETDTAEDAGADAPVDAAPEDEAPALEDTDTGETTAPEEESAPDEAPAADDAPLDPLAPIDVPVAPTEPVPTEPAPTAAPEEEPAVTEDTAEATPAEGAAEEAPVDAMPAPTPDTEVEPEPETEAGAEPEATDTPETEDAAPATPPEDAPEGEPSAGDPTADDFAETPAEPVTRCECYVVDGDGNPIALDDEGTTEVMIIEQVPTAGMVNETGADLTNLGIDAATTAVGTYIIYRARKKSRDRLEAYRFGETVA